MRRQDLNTIVSLGVGVVLLLGLSGWLIRDSRRRRAVEKDLQRTLREKTAATRALEQFTEVMAHHLQEPARRMASYAGLLRQKIMAGGAGVTVLGLSETIESQAIRQRALVRDVQLYLAVGQWGQSRDAEEAYETGDPAAVWGKLTAQLPDRGGGAPVRVSVGDLPRVPLGNRWLTHCLRQILDNALGHSDPDSPLEIRIRGEVRADATVLTVSDNGPGIPEAYRERVFGVFERLSTSGSPDRTGVGLAIVRRIMEAVGGRATARETPGGGTTIVLEFPNRETEP
jgi:signal transduction histidine kinase